MNVRILAIIGLFVILGNAGNAFADTNLKFGKIDKKNLEKTVCPIDSNAHAYFIFDDGKSTFEYANTTIDTRTSNGNKGFQLHFNRHFRIKILDNQGYDFANIEIPVYHNNNSTEQITKLKAVSYNLVDGKIEKTKIDRGDIRMEKSSQYWDTEKFALPNIKDGTIIEVEYTVVSDFFFNLQPWYFQRSIPTMESYYRVEIPEYFNYNISELGYFHIKKQEEIRRRELKLTIVEQADRLVGSGSQKYTHTVDFMDNIYAFSGEKIPAFPKEKFLKTERNYLTRIEFELRYTNFEGQSIHYYTTSWDEIDDDLNNSYNFGRELSHTNHLKDGVASLRSMHLEHLNLINTAFEEFKKHMKWNGVNSKYVTSSLSHAFKSGSGNCADINLNLVGLMRDLGFKSYPVILSTRKHGIIYPTHPSISSFNYVVAMVQDSDAVYLLDATDPYSEPNLLPVRCLNDRGRIIGDVPQKWINLMDYKNYLMSGTYQISFDDQMNIHSATNMRFKDYAAYQNRREIKETNDLNKFKEKLEKQAGNSDIENLKVAGLDSVEENLYLQYDLNKENSTEEGSGMVYFSPVIDPFFGDNPFKLEKREFPVEFNYPYQIQQVYTITIPENYQVEEVPKPLIVRLNGNSGKFMYQAQQLGNKLNVTVLMNLSKSMFLPAEYENLKKFFQMVIDKQHEYVVLKSI
ncbi:MAG TPA: DUF3857 domain-containing protein [Sunxiuqinia sp.]|nr:DUF3857 domain-containing protein [Sunxiuqinia sp.]